MLDNPMNSMSDAADTTPVGKLTALLDVNRSAKSSGKKVMMDEDGGKGSVPTVTKGGAAATSTPPPPPPPPGAPPKSKTASKAAASDKTTGAGVTEATAEESAKVILQSAAVIAELQVSNAELSRQLGRLADRERRASEQNERVTRERSASLQREGAIAQERIASLEAQLEALLRENTELKEQEDEKEKEAAEVSTSTSASASTSASTATIETQTRDSLVDQNPPQPPSHPPPPPPPPGAPPSAKSGATRRPSKALKRGSIGHSRGEVPMVEPAFWAEPLGISGDEKRLPAKQYCFDVLVHYPTHATTRGSMGDDEGAALVLGLQNLYGESCTSTIYCRD